MKREITVVIVEDEELAAKHLSKLLGDVEAANVSIVDHVDSVKNAMKWFLKNEAPDLILMDVDLSDGLCFEIFDVIDIQSPIIFTTAYDEYAIKAFKVNSIDYLLKPIDSSELEVAITKFLTSTQTQNQEIVRSIGHSLNKQHKERFVIKVGEHLKSIKTDEIGYFFSRDKASYAMVGERNYLLDFNMEQLVDVLDPNHFFRINRQYIVKIDAIRDIISYSNSRLRLVLENCEDNDVIVSRERVKLFKEWLDR